MQSLLARRIALCDVLNSPGLTSYPMPMPPGPNAGSGKFGTPCLRMQAALAKKLLCCVAEIGVGGALPFGMRLTHDWWAD